MANQTTGGGSSTNGNTPQATDDLFITGLLTSRTTADNHRVAVVRSK